MQLANNLVWVSAEQGNESLGQRKVFKRFMAIYRRPFFLNFQEKNVFRWLEGLQTEFQIISVTRRPFLTAKNSASDIVY